MVIFRLPPSIGSLKTIYARDSGKPVNKIRPIRRFRLPQPRKCPQIFVNKL